MQFAREVLKFLGALFLIEHSDVLNRGLYRAPLSAPQADD
jgi:hypothetical protein